MEKLVIALLISAGVLSSASYGISISVISNMGEFNKEFLADDNELITYSLTIPAGSPWGTISSEDNIENSIHFDLSEYDNKPFANTTENSSKNVKAYINKGVDLIFLQRLDEALIYLNKAIELDPQSAHAWYNKGIALRALGRINEAKAAFARSKDLWYQS